MKLDCHCAAFSVPANYDYLEPGLSKLEYAAIHIASGLAAAGHPEEPGTEDTARTIVNYAKRLLDECKQHEADDA